MRILFLSAWFPYPRDNGSKIRIYYLLRALCSHHEVTLLAFAYGSADPENALELKEMCKSVLAVDVDPISMNKTSRLRRFLSISPISSRPISEMTRAVNELFVDEQFDVVVSSTDVMSSYAMLGSKNRLKVLELHNSFSRWMREQYKHQNWGISRLRKWGSWYKARAYERRTYSKFQKIIMVSEADLLETAKSNEQLRKLMTVVPNGVDIEFNRPSTSSRVQNSLIFSGSLEYNVNYDAMAFFAKDIFPLVMKQIPEVKLTITGSHENIDLDRFSTSRNIIFSGNIDDIRALVSKSSVCVAPILEGGGTRLKVLEAMALGTPVVATSKAAESLDVTDRVHVLIADDPAEFATAVIELLTDNHLHERISENGRTLVENNYDWKEIGQRFLGVVEDCYHGR